MLNTFEVNKVLIIAPLRVARDTWPAEIEKWDHLKGLDISVIVGDVKTRIAAVHHPAIIYIVNRENIKWLVEYYEKNGMRWDFGMVVIDELSSFKNYQSQRFKYLRKVRPFVKRWVGLTGTPSSNGLMDLWAEIGILDGGERLGKIIGRYDGIGIAVGNGIGAFDLDDCFREDGTLNDTADTVLSIFPTAYVEKSPSGKGLRGFFHVAEDYVFDKTVYYISNRSKHLEVYMPGATNRFVTVTGDVYRTGEIPNDQTAMTTLLDSLMKRNKQVQQNHFQHHSYLDDEAVIRHAEEASNSEKFKKLYAGEWEKLYGSQSDADMAMLSILAFWCGCDEEQMDRIFRTTGLMHDKWDRKQAGTTYGAISIRNAVNSCAAVYTPVNAQDIVDEEFSKLDEDDYIEFQPDLSKITVTLEEMAPHTNARYGRNEIGMGNMFADYGRNTVRIALAAKKLRNVRTINISQLAPDLGNLHQDVICTLKLSSGSVCHNVNASKLL